MKISYNWLKEYIDVDLQPSEVAEILTDTGLEVEDVIEYKGPGQGLNGLVVGHVKKVEKHPDADKLKVTSVDTGNGSELQIVCGASNVAEGQKVVVAIPGTTLYPEKGEPFTIKKAKIRGVESSGMICAEDEIGIGTDHNGIIVLPEQTAVGNSVKDYYGVKEDYIFEIGLTPNRADAQSHIGVARDLAAALSIRKKKDYTLKIPETGFRFRVSGLDNQSISVIVENAEACPRYSGILLKNIKVAESPAWLQSKLRAVGLRPINNIVDITNFILQEFGQPLHAFDAEEIKGNKVVVKNLPDKTKFITLDETERSLDKNDLMICNESEGMCIAGVFGGLGSGVRESTTSIFLESAYFNPISIRKTSSRHNLRTDAAIRFEKGTDPNITVTALKRAVSMMLELAGGEIASEIIDVYPNPVPNVETTIDYKNVDRLIGYKIEREIIRNILAKLGIEILKEENDTLKISIPPLKVDVKREVDVIEEILRIYGFNNIPLPEQLRMSLSYSSATDKQESQHNSISNYLAAAGFNEMVTNSLSQSGYYERTKTWDDKTVGLLKSANAELNVLRANMLFSGLEVIAYNLNRRNNDLRFFELGKTYQKNSNGSYSEQKHLALFLTGNKHEDSWTAKKEKVNFYYLKSFVDNVLKRLGIENWKDGEVKSSNFKYGLQYFSGDAAIVEFGLVNDVFQREFDIKHEVFYADFNWDKITEFSMNRSITVKDIPKFPGMRRDLAVLLSKNITYREVEKIAGEEGKRILKAVNLFDIYEDVKLGDNMKSYAVSFFFEDENKTLTDKDVDKIMDKLISRYKKELNAEIR